VTKKSLATPDLRYYIQYTYMFVNIYVFSNHIVKIYTNNNIIANVFVYILCLMYYFIIILCLCLSVAKISVMINNNDIFKNNLM